MEATPEELLNARVRFWQCPVSEHTARRGVVTVEWRDDIAHCTADGCTYTSVNSRGPRLRKESDVLRERGEECREQARRLREAGTVDPQFADGIDYVGRGLLALADEQDPPLGSTS